MLAQQSTAFSSRSPFNTGSLALAPIPLAARAMCEPHTSGKLLLEDAAGANASSRTKKIEDIDVGDLVWAWDEVAGNLVKRPVMRLFRHMAKPILGVTIADDDGGNMQVIEATTEHPFWIAKRGWVAASELREGDVLKRIDAGSTMQVVSVKRTGKKADVFNFEVDEVHTYFVGAHGVLVHNESARGPAGRTSKQLKGLEIELPASLAEHFVHNLDMRRISDSQMLQALNPAQPGLVKLVQSRLKGAGIDASSMDFQTAAGHFRSVDDLGPRGRTYGLIAVGGRAPMLVTGDSTLDAIRANLNTSTDGHKLEVRNTRPTPGFDNIYGQMEDVASLFSSGAGVSPETFARRTHWHLSEAGQNIVHRANGVNLILGMDAMNAGRDKLVFGQTNSVTQLGGIWQRGMIRVMEVGGNGKSWSNRLEFRWMNNPAVDAVRFPRWMSDEASVYSDMNSTVAQSHASLDRLMASAPPFTQYIAIKQFATLFHDAGTGRQVADAISNMDRSPYQSVRTLADKVKAFEEEAP